MSDESLDQRTEGDEPFEFPPPERKIGTMRSRFCRGVVAASAVGVLAGLLVVGVAASQEPVPRILQHDSTLDNLVEPAGYMTAELGTLGGNVRTGEGPGHMILIPGLGLGGEVFEPLMSAWNDDFTMLAVTLPGFGGTPAPRRDGTDVLGRDSTR